MKRKITTTVLMLIATSALLVGGLLGMGQGSAVAATHYTMAKAAPNAIGFDFEDGSTQGWSIVSHSINGTISLANSTQQAYHGTHALAVDTMDYNFGGSQATIGSGTFVASSPITAYLYMITDDISEPYPGPVYAQLKLTDSGGQVFTGVNTRLYHQQWVVANLSFPNNATTPYTMSVFISYSNVRPTHRTVWLDYVQWGDAPNLTTTPLPPTNTTNPSTPTPTPTAACNFNGYGNWQLAANAPQHISYGAATGSSSYAYFAGGYNGTTMTDTNQFSRYDPFANQWATLTPMPDAVEGASAVYAASSNKVYVFGGLHMNPQFDSRQTRIYDVASNSWSLGPNMPDMRYWMAEGYWNGKIYLVGGAQSGAQYPPYNQTWEFDVAGSSFITKTALPISQNERSASAVVNGHLYVAGGVDGNGNIVNTLYDYDIAANSWTTQASLPYGDYDAGAAAINGKLWVFGGSSHPTATYIYDPATNTWSTGPTLNHNHLAHGGTAVGQFAIAIGGLDGVGWTNITEVSDNRLTQCPATPTITGTPYTATPTNTPTVTPTCHPYICEPLSVNLSYSNLTANSVDLYAVANFDIGTYTFYRSTDGTNFTIVGSAQGHYGSFTDTGLACNTIYYYYAHATEYGWGQRQANSNTVTLTTASCGGTTVTPTSSYGISPTVTPVLDVTIYVIEVNTTTTRFYSHADFNYGYFTLYRSQDGMYFDAVDTQTGGYSGVYLNDSGLNCSTMYYYYAHAVEYGGFQRNGNSPTITVTTLPCGSTPTRVSQPSATPTLCGHQFTDINGNVFYTAIVGLYCRGVVSGTDSTHFGPAGQATRAQFAKIVVLGFGFPLLTPTGGPTFNDVPSSYFAYTYIESGYARGILSGFDPASCAAAGIPHPCYLPNRNITRAQVTKLVVLAANWPLLTPANGQPTFNDVPTTHWAFSYVETSYANPNGIRGYSDGTFRPNNNIRRDEMAQIVYRASSAPLGQC